MNNKSIIFEIGKWYKKSIGKALLQSEIVGLADALPKMFGYYIVQIGGPLDNSETLSSSYIHNHIIIGSDNVFNGKASTIQCQLDELPFLPESIDVVVMFHILELTQNHTTILEEVYSALIPGGYVIIFGFNPCSLWGIKYLWKPLKEIPWTNNWIRSKHMRQLLCKVGFSISDYKTFYFRPLNNSSKKLLFLEKIGQIFWPYCGASYMFVAQKTIAGLIPIKPKISTKQFEDAKTLPKPAARVSQCNKTQVP